MLHESLSFHRRFSHMFAFNGGRLEAEKSKPITLEKRHTKSFPPTYEICQDNSNWNKSDETKWNSKLYFLPPIERQNWILNARFHFLSACDKNLLLYCFDLCSHKFNLTNNLFSSLPWANVLSTGAAFENKKTFCAMNYLTLIWAVKSVFPISCFLSITKREKLSAAMETIVF